MTRRRAVIGIETRREQALVFDESLLDPFKERSGPRCEEPCFYASLLVHSDESAVGRAHCVRQTILRFPLSTRELLPVQLGQELGVRILQRSLSALHVVVDLRLRQRLAPAVVPEREDDVDDQGTAPDPQDPHGRIPHAAQAGANP